ncbi:MAG: MFS transporter [Candidatus Lernaella stagnicola]|nr:MFS transporter [Candidatus Lernaella stagnicola]
MRAHQRLLFFAGQLGIMCTVRFFFQWIIDFTHAPPPGASAPPLFPVALVGLVLLGFRIFDAATDPVAGTFADRWVAAGRQRRSLLWFSFLLPGIGLAMIFAPYHGMSVGWRWTLLVAGMFVYFIGYTAFAIPYWSLVEDYATGDRKTRSSLSSLLGLGTLVATVIAFVVTPYIVDRFGFFAAALAIAVGAVILMPAAYFAAPAASRAERAPRRPRPSAALLKSALTDRRFLSVLCVFAGSQMAFTMLSAAAPFVAVDLLRGSRGDVALILGPLLLVAIPCFAGASRLSLRIGWERAVVGAGCGLCVIYFLTYLLGIVSIGSLLGTAILLYALAGPLVAVMLGLEGEAIATCARNRGGEAVSVYFGTYNFTTKALNGLSIAITGAMVALSDGSCGATAIRLTGPLSGGFLALGILLYFVLRPRRR